MMGKRQLLSALTQTAAHQESRPFVRALAVGDPAEWRKQGYTLPSEGLAFVGFHEVTMETLEFLQPSVIFSPVLAKSFDCIDLAITLYKLGFPGQYCALAVRFPKPTVIEREVRQMCPHLDFRIVEKL